jgi:hypothetical protein
MVLFAALLLVPLCAQEWELHSKLDPKSMEERRNSPGRWMLAPVDIHNQKDAATPTERQIRDRHWDKRIGARAPLSSDSPVEHEVGVKGHRFSIEEFTDWDLLGGVWLTGTFEGYRTYLSSSERSIYTEIDFRVTRIVGHPKVPDLHVDSLVTIGRPGGTVLYSQGHVISYQGPAREHDFQPAHSYLLRLEYVPSGNYFIDNDVHRWDIGDGTAKPDTYKELSRSYRGESSIAGLPVENAMKVLEDKIDEMSRHVPR